MPLKWLSLRSPIPVVKHLTSVAFAHINHVTVLKLSFLGFYEAVFSWFPSCFSDHFSVSFSRHLFLCSSLNVSDPQRSVLALFSSLLDDLHHFCAFNYHPYCVSSGFPKSIHQDVIRCARDWGNICKGYREGRRNSLGKHLDHDVILTPLEEEGEGRKIGRKSLRLSASSKKVLVSSMENPGTEVTC